MNDEQRTKLEANVTDWLKDHVYTELTNANGVEVWRCKQPGSHNLAFDICVTRYGTAVFGDIGHLTFDIDASYGIKWIANTGLHNLHGKLAESCKEVWIDKDAILETVRDCICEALEEDGVEHPEGMSVEALIEWLKKESSENVVEPPVDEWLEVLDRITQFDDGTDRDVVPAFDLLAESERLLRTSDTWETCFTKPSDHVWRKLFYVRHAANAIMAKKAATEAMLADRAKKQAPATVTAKFTGLMDVVALQGELVRVRSSLGVDELVLELATAMDWVSPFKPKAVAQ